MSAAPAYITLDPTQGVTFYVSIACTKERRLRTRPSRGWQGRPDSGPSAASRESMARMYLFRVRPVPRTCTSCFQVIYGALIVVSTMICIKEKPTGAGICCSSNDGRNPRMSWLGSNWIWLAFGLAFIALHLFGHGSHGAAVHSRRRNEQTGDWPRSSTAATADHDHESPDRPTASTPAPANGADRQSGHRHHGC